MADLKDAPASVPLHPTEQDIAPIVEQFIADAVAICDPKGEVIYWNRAAELMFGFSRAEMLGRDMHDHITPERLRERAKSGFARFVKTGEGDFIGRVVRLDGRRADGTEFPIELSISTIPVGGKNCAIAVVRDMTRRARLEDELLRLATTCTLTDVMNRRQFVASSQAEIVRSWRTKSSTTIFILDIDRFRTLNDRYGHAAGDAALKAIGACCKETLRATDLVGRLGGEEFAALLPDTPLQPAAEVCDRLRLKIKRLQVVSEGRPLSLTVSVGVAEHRRGQESLEDTLRRAEHALLQAKNGGRDRLWVATDDDPAPHA